jgi:hypothetical protein
MSKELGCMIVLLCSLSFVVPSAMADVVTAPLTIKGDLLSIKGDVWVIKDIFGRLVYLYVDKADVIIGEKVVALRPAK